MTPRPDPAVELRLTALATARGANYWSRAPVTRLDVAVGAYDALSSAEVPGVAERLLAALPGLVEHRCSIGERGGFLTRLRRGTYAPHIIEHVALELQRAIGHDVGYGRTRGGDVAGEYTIVVEHRHAGVGRRAATLALDAVQRAFAGTLGPLDAAVAALAAAAAAPDDAPRPTRRVLCGVTGGAHRAAAADLLRARGAGDDGLVVDVAPAELLRAGLPYRDSALGVVLDVAPRDVPVRYRARDRAERLLGVVADGVRRGGLVVAPAAAWDVQDLARDRGCRVAVFGGEGPVASRDARVAALVAWAEGGRLRLEHGAGVDDAGPVRADLPLAVQLAAALARTALPAAAPLPERARDAAA